jgi:hypothetical protein
MTQTTTPRAVLYARYEPEWDRMMLCSRDEFGAVEYRLAPAPASGGVEAVAELLAGLSAFDHSMACHVGIGYFDGTEITQEWDQLVRPAMERLKTASPSPAATPVSEAGGEAITARYTNWRGETAERTFIPHRVFFGSNEWHPEPQVLIEATDCEKGALRTFAAAGFAIAKPASSPATWHALDEDGSAELRVNGQRITSFPSYPSAEEAARRINDALKDTGHG